MSEIRENTKKRIQDMRDQGMSDREIELTLMIETLEYHTDLEIKTFGKSSCLRKFYKKKVSRKFLRRQMLSTGWRDARWIDNYIDTKHREGMTYQQIWHRMRIDVMADQYRKMEMKLLNAIMNN